MIGLNKLNEEILEDEKLGDVKFYVTSSGLDKTERARRNANILFSEMVSLTNKKYHVIIVNGQKNGGVMYLYDRSNTPTNDLINDIFKELDELLNVTFQTFPGGEITVNKEGFTKVPFGKVKKHN